MTITKQYRFVAKYGSGQQMEATWDHLHANDAAHPVMNEFARSALEGDNRHHVTPSLLTKVWKQGDDTAQLSAIAHPLHTREMQQEALTHGFTSIVTGALISHHATPEDFEKVRQSKKAGSYNHQLADLLKSKTPEERQTLTQKWYQR